ncbi:MAG: two-component regulator propeller domain-containing protein, partial [Adhaeribacter sp.]
MCPVNQFKQTSLFLILLALLLPAGRLQAQSPGLPIGSWQVHLPHNRATAVALAGDKVYAATGEGLFALDLEFNQLQVLSRSQGFTGGKVSTLDYDPASATLLIAYENTSIDLVQQGQVIPIPDIFRKNIPGGKQINHVYFQDQVAYLSCSFGVVLLDLLRREIKDTYSNLGAGGQGLQVYASTILGDSLYLATSNGLMAARRSQNNLADYRNWKTFSGAPGLPAFEPGDMTALASFNNKVYAGIRGQDVYRFNGQAWTPTGIGLAGKTAWQLKANGTVLQLVDGERIVLLDNSGGLQAADGPQVQQPRAAVAAGAGAFWVADYGQGLVKLEGSQTTSFFPNGPLIPSAFRVYAAGPRVLLLGGGYDQAYQHLNQSTGFALLQDGQWQTYSPQLLPDPGQFPGLQDLVAVAANPVNGKLYFASYGFGLLAWEGLGRFQVYDPANSPLLTALPGNNGYTRLPGVTVDAAGNVWVTNRHQQPNAPGLHVLKTDGSWQSFLFPGFADGGNLEKILLDHQQLKWMSVSRRPDESARGLLVFDERSGRHRHLSTGPGAGNLPGAEVYALALDQDGPVWVGTDKGLAVFYEPDQVLENGAAGASTPMLDGRPLLQDQAVKALAVDGGNRKWVGTDTGLWLFSEEGDRVIAHFTTANSPLPSDQILDIAVHHASGEVFIVTAAGLVSYRGTATITEGKPSCAQVFPNPVRPGYTGQVGLSGLPNQATVRITDITGTLVYQTRAAGGMVSWDLKDQQGRRVRSGVYLAFSASPDGRQACL